MQCLVFLEHLKRARSARKSCKSVSINSTQVLRLGTEERLLDCTNLVELACNNDFYFGAAEWGSRVQISLHVQFISNPGSKNKNTIGAGAARRSEEKSQFSMASGTQMGGRHPTLTCLCLSI